MSQQSRMRHSISRIVYIEVSTATVSPLAAWQIWPAKAAPQRFGNGLFREGARCSGLGRADDLGNGGLRTVSEPWCLYCNTCQ